MQHTWESHHAALQTAAAHAMLVLQQAWCRALWLPLWWLCSWPADRGQEGTFGRPWGSAGLQNCLMEGRERLSTAQQPCKHRARPSAPTHHEHGPVQQCQLIPSPSTSHKDTGAA